MIITDAGTNFTTVEFRVNAQAMAIKIEDFSEEAVKLHRMALFHCPITLSIYPVRCRPRSVRVCFESQHRF